MFQCDEILNKKLRYFVQNCEDFASHVFHPTSVQIFGASSPQMVGMGLGVVIINETESSFLDVFKFVCVGLTTKVPDQRTVVDI